MLIVEREILGLSISWKGRNFEMGTVPFLKRNRPKYEIRNFIKNEPNLKLIRLTYEN